MKRTFWLLLLAALAAAGAHAQSVSITGPTGSFTATSSTALTGTTSGYTTTQSLTITGSANGTTIGTASITGNTTFSIPWTITAPGTFTLRAAPNTGTAGTATVTATGVAPTVSFTLVGGNTSIPAGSSRYVTITANDDGGIDHVELYYDGTLLSSKAGAPYSILFTAPNSIGLHSLVVRAYDNVGLSTDSATTIIEIGSAVGNAPTGTITTPLGGAFLPVGTTTITGTATDTDGTISQVTVYANGVLIGTIPGTSLSAGTWSTAWTPAAPGTFLLTAIVVDDKNNAIVLPASTVTVTDTTAPTVTVTLSPGGTTLPTGATRYIVATVTPAAGRAVARVQFFINGTLVSDKTSGPFSYRYTAPSTPGNYSLVVRATDNAGVSRDAQSTLSVVSAIGNPPTTSLITPANGITVVPGAALSLAATALSSGGSIASVSFYQNGSLIASATTSPYATAFNPPSPGSYVLEAIATDDRGNTTVSNAVTITAAFAGPTISITTPTGTVNNPTRLTPGVPVTISANAQGTGGAGISLVEYFLAGVLIGTKAPPATTGTTYSISFTPTTAQIGTGQPLTARVTDTNSLQTTSNAVYVTIATAAVSPPVINTVGVNPTPTAGLQTLSTVNLVANAFSNATGGSISSVEFFLNDLSAGLATREGTTNLWRLVFNFSNYDFSAITPDANGRYPLPLYAIARDNSGNQSVSATTNLLINPAQSAAPTLSLTALTPTTFVLGNTFTIVPFFNDTDGTVTSLQLYSNGVVSGGAIANPQLGITLINFTPTAAGTFRLFAVATDDTGNTAFSSPIITVTVTANAAPATVLTRPTDDATVTNIAAPVFLEGTVTTNNATITPTLTFTATASGGAITNINSNRVSTVGTLSIFRSFFIPATADTFTITATGTVGAGAGAVTSVSPQARKVLVNALVGIPPTVTMPSPGTVTSASTVSLSATATDADGSVASVEFFINRQSIGFGERQQLTNLWRITTSFGGLTPGTYDYQAIARDNSGNLAATAPNTTFTIVNAISAAPVVSITATPPTVAFNQPITLNANAFDSDGNVASVAYFSNGVQVGTGAAAPLWQFNYNPGVAGTYTVYAVATDATGNTAVSSPLTVKMKSSNPVLDDDAFILQTYTDLLFTTPSSFQLQTLSNQFVAGTMTRAKLVETLQADPSFTNVVNVLAAYYVIMGQWPTTANYTTILAQRGNLATVCNTILNSPEFAVKYAGQFGGLPVTAAKLTASFANATAFYIQLAQNAGRAVPSGSDLNLAVFRFQNNDTASPTLGRGYNATNLQTAVAEFITLTNSDNTALFKTARAAALYYQLDKPTIVTKDTAAVTTTPVTTQEAAATRVATLGALPDTASVANAVLNDVIYTYRYVTILAQPSPLLVAPRSGALFSVTAVGQPPISYQWLLNGAPIAGATNSLLSVTNVDSTKTGTYSVVVTTAVGSTTSDPTVLAMSSLPTRLGNISTRGPTAGGNNVLIGGFVIAGTQTKQVLIRVIGPTLAANGVTGALADPRLELYSSANVLLQSNDDWGTQGGNAAANAASVAAIVAATTRVGAFPLQANSRDAVVLATLQPGLYSVQAKGPTANAAGVVLFEVYDASTTLTGPKAVDVSTRGNVGTGENIFIAGFSVSGTVARRVLIRGVGPTLRNFGVTSGFLADPQLELFDGNGKSIKVNDDWAADPVAAPIIAAAATAAGAFPLQNGGKDSAMIVMLPPGTYSAHLSGVNNTTGVALVEVYDVDP